MCRERIHRLMMASVIGTGATLVHQGFGFGEYVLWFVVGMLVVYATANFCPSVWILGKLGLKSCSEA
ncbi:MAG: hypothetical protein A2600_03090 [Candidatus Lambdaproteobacteria bacterium RIFOXYD1_FULL_56_27]|uniref:DUF2892 domain-containing protein n=1 Tax=Candidatus Lambdaproteobacteria bacterium RIFOXYD2_FULL_56_26 TaxID=1817773 RepID=A0A1F6H2Y3_9PROT|nr:MAG: hypothetical protein A2557_07155 [Candidatus Lambdaproteobacteria bacterium RIFOXYD2_FULL_56_26]OGH05378.1 MAG: hypothetical protein A2426_05480 [Candidatus Lambdaproteobacteria bacterium RIFOXYC1_FULL_56_13]OGH09222.1 MAG: hypothetical protein A2600_03090 [Candidatus Lambdaproteobacteria bacterium RIFOXYD1_FULL_56_27]